MTLFLTKNTQDRKKIHNSVKTYDILMKQKVSESWWSAVSISDKKKLFSILGVAPNDPFFVQIGPKKQLRDFTNFFSELLDCNTSY